MKPVNQTRYYTDGNCLAACIASILEIDLAIVDFTANTDGWLAQTQKVLKPLGVGYLGITLDREPFNIMVPPDSYCIFVGTTKRNQGTDLLHCVVGRIAFDKMKGENPIVRFETIHDPNDQCPEGLLGTPSEIGYLVPLNPATAIHHLKYPRIELKHYENTHVR